MGLYIKEELGDIPEDPNNPWVWLTSFSRIPVHNSVKVNKPIYLNIILYFKVFLLLTICK
jgi:hypothetical protein